MRDLISLTNAQDNSSFTVAVHAIGIVERQPSYEEPGKAILTLSLGKSGKHIYHVIETYEEVIDRIKEAQQPTIGQV